MVRGIERRGVLILQVLRGGRDLETCSIIYPSSAGSSV